jgi:hypothetical protein
MLDHLSRLRDGRSRRVSSWDTTGRNHDAWRVDAGETKVLADLTGAGVIRHLWFTIGAEDPLYLRLFVLRMYWDGQSHPSVEAPVGDSFGVGHSKAASYSCSEELGGRWPHRHWQESCIDGIIEPALTLWMDARQLPKNTRHGFPDKM